MEATLNVRMPKALKERGDKVLRENGISTSDAVRALWNELASSRRLPSFLAGESGSEKRKAAKLLALDRLAGIAEGSLSNLTDDELADIGMQRYE